MSDIDPTFTWPFTRFSFATLNLTPANPLFANYDGSALGVGALRTWSVKNVFILELMPPHSAGRLSCTVVGHGG